MRQLAGLEYPKEMPDPANPSGSVPRKGAVGGDAGAWEKYLRYVEGRRVTEQRLRKIREALDEETR